MSEMKVYCPNCGKELGELFSHVLCGQYPMEVDSNGRKRFFCGNSCIEEYKKKFQIGFYKGREVYLVDRGAKKGYLPYWDCLYYFTTLEECLKSIDG